MGDPYHRYLEALRAEEQALDPDPGTTRTPPTVRKGTVTQADPLKVATTGDGLPAVNVSAHNLALDDVVLMLVDQGRRFVIGRF